MRISWSGRNREGWLERGGSVLIGIHGMEASKVERELFSVKKEESMPSEESGREIRSEAISLNRKAEQVRSGESDSAICVRVSFNRGR